jgi:hypothetical protein
MENAGIFTLGDVTERNYRTGSSLREFTLFHSRRVGLSDDRRPVPIAGGGRLTGRIGGFEVGLLNMQTRRSDSLAPENFAVARVRRALPGGSDVGIMFINREGTSDQTAGYNRTFGADANLRLFEYLLVNSYYARTDDPAESGDENAARVQVAWRDAMLDASAFAKHVGDGFNPEVGFVRRRAMRQLFVSVGAHPQPGITQIVEFNPYVDMSVISDLDWSLETRTAAAGLGVAFLDGGMLNVEFTNSFERLAEPDQVAGVLLAAGDYRFNDAAIRYTASGGRWLSGNVQLSRGGFFDGDRTSVRIQANLRPDYHMSINLSAQRNAGTLADSAFTADVFGARVRYALSTRFFASGFVQYNTSSDELVTNLRINLIHAPLSDLFLVYTERRDLEADVLLDRVLAVKVTKLFAF